MAAVRNSQRGPGRGMLQARNMEAGPLSELDLTTSPLHEALSLSYLLLVVEPPGQRRTVTEDEGRERYARMKQFAQELQQRGELVGAEALKDSTSPGTSAARVSVRDGNALLLDGPFAEAKEMIGGFFLLNKVSRERAMQIARDCPAASWATIEVRELGPCFL